MTSLGENEMAGEGKEMDKAVRKEETKTSG